MINVLFVISNLNRQGPINQLFYLCKYIDKSIINPIIVTTSQKSFENSMHNNFKAIGIQIIDLKMSKIKSVLVAKKQIQKIINDKSIDIIQSFGFRSDLISYNLKKVFKITTVRNRLLYNSIMIRGPILGLISGKTNLYVIKKFDSIISCSYSVQKYLKTFNVNSDVILNSVNPDKISEKFSNSNIQNLRRKLYLTEKSKIFLTVSSKIKGKNIEFLIDSFQKKELDDYLLVITGYVSPTIIDKNNSKRNIHFTGNVRNLIDYIRATDYFISASLHEGMPNAVLEALSLGTPVILSDIPSHLEILNKSDLPIGTAFRNNDSLDLIEKIAFIQSLDYTNLVNNCKYTIDKYFNAKEMAKSYEEYYSAIYNNF